ncbi:MAG TPA: GNAT family N-acetyltransferase [Casimicrobiaceae bacterium]|jgi:GNAT superfamily N-acetyltransferase
MIPTVQRVGSSARKAFLAHLVALPSDDVRLRFGSPLAAAAIAAYVDRIDFERDAVFAVYDDNLAIVGAAHVGFFDDAAELGVSVLPSQRRHGLGTALVIRASDHARNRRTMRIYMHCLAENAAMMTIARRAGMSIVVNAGEADAHLALPPASPASVTREYVSDQLALIDFALKAHVDALRRATDAVGGANT